MREEPAMIRAKPSPEELTVHGLAADEVITVRPQLPSLIATLESAVATVSGRGAPQTLDRAGCLLAPAGDAVVVAATGAASRIAAVAITPRATAGAEREFRAVGFDRGKLARWIARRALLPRTVWVHELVHRYVFERHALGNADNQATRFLEIELAKEVYFLFRDRADGAERTTIVHAHSRSVAAALAHVEAHLFEPCDVARLVRAAGASESTLLRQFRSEVGCGPGAYWRNRQLDEALLALRAGRSVAEVAARVGYESPSAFGSAFRRRFGRTPSSVRPRGRARAAP
jgi:AraC-like DNA-binding protein